MTVKGVHRLAAFELDTLIGHASPEGNKKVKFYDGGGLEIVVDRFGARWGLKYISPMTGTRRELGLGRYPDITLQAARQHAAEARMLIADGRDPIFEKTGRAPSGMTIEAQPEHGEWLSGLHWKLEFDKINGMSYSEIVEVYSDAQHALEFIRTVRNAL